MDIARNDLEFLLKNITANSAVLFLGAGFSADAKNRKATGMPIGAELARILWEFLNYPGDYDGSALATVFEAALTKRKHIEIQQLLDENFRCAELPEWYLLISKIFWMRIYTTNVDDVVERIYASRAVTQKLDVINAISEDYRERDQFLEYVQYVKLNGTLTEKPTSITFSLRQYAERLASMEVWYDQFVRDYSTRCTVFIGTKLEEPMFWQAVAARGKRFGDVENRPRSFIVAPSFSPAHIDMLREFRVIPVVASAHDFLEEVAHAIGTFPTLNEVVIKTNPGLEAMLRALGTKISDSNRRHITEFYRAFHPVPTPKPNSQYRSMFLLGSEPQWQDMYCDFDAPRAINSDLVEDIQLCLREKEATILALTGSAGSGKSTVLKRVAVTLATSGNPVFFTACEALPALHHFEAALDLIPPRSVLIFDNASLASGIMPDYLTAAKRANQKHCILVAARTHKLIERLPAWNSILRVRETPIPDLTANDADNIIDVLEREQLLGQLANTPRAKQREIFMSYAHRQILVAMRRATLGKGFDQIIKDEFLTLEPLEAQMLYLCASIVTEAQFTITKQQLMACVDCPPAEALTLITQNLRNVLIPVLESPDRYTARHRMIAEMIVDSIAPRGMLKEAYIHLLKTISHDLPIGGNTSAAIFRLYRRLINHRTIYERFAHHLAEARLIYSTVASGFARDHHFWLQFGSLELEYGELEHAANYIEQAQKYAPHDNIVLTTRAHLLYKQSLTVTLIEQARELRNEAREILLHQMASRSQDHYPFHIYCTQELAWVNHWLPLVKDRIPALEELRQFANTNLTIRPQSNRLKEIVTLINGAYLDLAKPGEHGSTGFNPVIS